MRTTVRPNALTLKAQVIDTHHTVLIEGIQIDIIYNFHFNMMEVYVDGNYKLRAVFTPARLILSYTNILDVATTYYLHHIQSLKQQSDESQNV